MSRQDHAQEHPDEGEDVVLAQTVRGWGDDPVSLPPGGAARARRSAGRRHTARTGGIALAVTAVVLAVPLALTSGGEQAAPAAPQVSAAPAVTGTVDPSPAPVPDVPTEAGTGASPAPRAPTVSDPDPVTDRASLDGSATTGPVTTGTATTGPAGFVDVSPDGYADGPSFTSPSGNIRCAMWDLESPPVVFCRADQASWASETTRCTAGEEALDHDPAVIELSDEVVVGRCANDTPFSPDAQVLDYGEGWVMGDLVCVSRRDGVTCTTDGGSPGFRIARASYEVF